MKIKFGAIVTDGRGKLGGHVFSKNGGGSYIRTKVTPTNPQSIAQTAVRAVFGVISGAWSGLTEAQRLGWNGAVELWQTTNIFGDLKKPNGKALFQRLNNQAQASGYSAVTSVPAKLDMVSGTITAVPVNLTASTIFPTGVYSGGDARVVIGATASQSAGTRFVKNKLRQIYTDLGTGFTSTDVFTAYEAKFGTILVTDNIYVSVKYVLPNGQASPPQILKCTISA